MTTARLAVLSPAPGPSALLDEGAALSAEAAASPFTPPATERHAAFLKLVDSAAKAGLLCRFLRCADFSALAAVAGVPLFEDDSAIIGRVRLGEARSLHNQAMVEAKRGPAGAAEAGALRRRAWTVLASLSLPVLQRRIDEGTLLPGKCRPVDEAFCVYEQQLCSRVMEKPVPTTDKLLFIATCGGYATALEAAFSALNLLPSQHGNPEGAGAGLCALRAWPHPQNGGAEDQAGHGERPGWRDRQQPAPKPLRPRLLGLSAGPLAQPGGGRCAAVPGRAAGRAGLHRGRGCSKRRVLHSPGCRRGQARAAGVRPAVVRQAGDDGAAVPRLRPLQAHPLLLRGTRQAALADSQTGRKGGW